MSQKQNARTYARNRTKLSRRGFEKNPENDMIFLFKLILCALISLFWIKTHEAVSIPLGLFVGFLGVYFFEKRQDNRRIFYAVSLICGIISFFLPIGFLKCAINAFSIK